MVGKKRQGDGGTETKVKVSLGSREIKLTLI